jgi:hypothetical protein
MIKPIIKTAATASDEPSAIDVLVRAFAADPISHWILPDSQQYHMYFPSFVRAFGGKAFTHRSAYYVDGYAAAALWLPPNVLPDEDMLSSISQRSVSEQIQKDVISVLTRWVPITQASRIGICRSWVSTHFYEQGIWLCIDAAWTYSM